MMLRGGRLGDISQDVLRFISSRDADARIFEADVLVDRAHLVMLKEQGLISPEDCERIIDALNGIREGDLGEGEDVHEAIEALVISKVGNLGGRMHTGRSRNDEVATCIRLALRVEMLGLMEEIMTLVDTLVGIAGQNTETIVPGFTHTQHAQPTTLAHHLLAHADAFSRDMDRLMDAYGRVNMSPLGAAAFASTGFDIDRERTAALLGFDGLVENSMDAVSTRDFMIEVLSDLSILMVNLSRLAEEVVLWSTTEFGYLELDDLFASTSSIMPQKKNPDTAELCRGKTGSVIGAMVSVLTIVKSLPMSYNRDLQEATTHLWRSLDWTRGGVRIMGGLMATARWNKDRLKAASGQGFSTATEIADSLVRATGMPFRTAHQIVGRLAAKGGIPTLDDLDAAGLQVAGIAPSKAGFTEEMLSRALDPVSNVALRDATGGPAPSETRRMVADRLKKVEVYRDRISSMKAQSDGALEALRNMR